jgi:lipoprotein signal peptidase
MRRRQTDLEPNTGWIPVASIAGGVAALDWATKFLVTVTVPLDGFVILPGQRAALWHVQNPALVLGLFGNLPLPTRQVLSVLLGIAALTLLIETVSRAHRLLPRRRPWAWIFAGLLLGGMIGNLGERMLHWWVTDFLSFRYGGIWLPPGNVADLAIILSIPIAFLVIAFEVEARAMRGRGAQLSSPRRRPTGATSR